MKILLACGGTGGHIFPAFSVAEELRRRHPDVEVVYVCGTKDIEDRIFGIVKENRVLTLKSVPFGGKSALFNPLFLLELVCAFRRASALLRAERPDLVAGFGGYSAFPVVWSARRLGIKTLLHEQNVIPGRANRFLAHRVDRIAVSYRETAGRIGNASKVRLTGNPIRSSIERADRREALEKFGFSADRKTLLVLGGSQGAESINRFFLEAVPYLPEALRRRLQVLHLCGRMPVSEAVRALEAFGIPSKAFSFFDRMDLAYAVTDLALGRAGATFLAEIATKQVPAILIPYPFAGGHQIANAEVFCRAQDAVMLRQETVTAERLAVVLARKLEGSSDAARPAAANGAPDGTAARSLLADEILSLAERP